MGWISSMGTAALQRESGPRPYYRFRKFTEASTLPLAGIGEAGESFQPIRLGPFPVAWGRLHPPRQLTLEAVLLIEQIEDHGLILASPTEGYVRTPGLHMSELYNNLYKAIDPKRYDKRDKDGNPLPLDEMACEVGTAFEEAIEPVIRRRVIGAERPGEYVTQHDRLCVHRNHVVRVGDAVCPCGAGVIYSPDHFLFNGVFRLGEFKCTKMSIRKGIRDRRFDKWFTQMKVYCYHLQTPYARLIACFINGDYTDFSYKLIPWDITFSEREMYDEWQALLKRGRKDGVIPT